MPCLLLLLLTLLAPGVGVGAVLDEPAATWVQAQRSVRLAPDPDYPPIDFFDARGRHSGLSAGLTALLSERSALRFEVQRYPDFAAVRAALAAGEVDVASSVFKTPQRAEQMLFSTPYLRLPAALIGRLDAAEIGSLEDLKGRRIALVQGHVWQELLIDAGFGDELQPATSLVLALRSVADGAADAYVGDLYSADYALRQSGLSAELGALGESGLEASLAYAIRPDLPELKRVLDQALASVSAAEEAALRLRWEGQGTLSEVDPAMLVAPSVRAELLALQAELKAGDSTSAAAIAAQEKLDQAIEADAKADASLAELERMRREVAEAQRDLNRNGAQSGAEELLRWRGSLPQRATLNELEQILATEQAARSSLQEALARANQQALEWQQRPVQLRRELADLMAQIDAVVLPEADARIGARIERAAQTAALRALMARQALLQFERQHVDLLMRAAELRRRDRQRAQALRSERVAVLEALIAERSDSELNDELALLRAQNEQYAEASSAFRDLAAENLASGEDLLRQTRRLTQLREQVLRLEQQASQVAQALDNARTRIEIGGITESVGVLLLAERRKLPNAAALRAQQAALQVEAADVQLAQIVLAEEREELANLRSAIARRIGSDADAQAQISPEQRAQMTDLLLLRAQLLPRLQQQNLRLQESLAQSELHIAQLLRDGAALTALMEQNLLWIPSHRAVGAGWGTRLGEDWLDLLRPARWTTAGQRLIQRLPDKPIWILALLLPFALLALRPKLDGRIVKLAERTRNLRADRYQYTLQTLGLSALRAAPIALLLLLLGHMLQSVGEGGRFTHSLGRALQGLAPYAYLFTLIASICREQGLAHAHLRWARARRTALLRLRPLLYFVLLPLLFLASVCFARDLDSVNGTVLRSLLVCLHFLMAGLSWWLLHPERLPAVRGGGAPPYPGLRRALRAGLCLGFIVLALLPLFGYVFTSAVLLKVALDVMLMVFAVALAHGLVLRWLALGERQLAMAQQQSGDVGGDLVNAGANLDAPGFAQDSIDLKLVSVQSRSLLRAMTALLLGFGLIWALSDVAPAFRLLDRVILWQSSDTVDGSEILRAVTLGSLVLALLALAIGVVAARNVPGLLEILLLQRFTQDASVRYAVVTVTRYVITFLVLVAVFGFLGVRWGHLQWLAAGFSVGLGFGLQEIFGNFVAGLILLFERPFRVGDVVTIGDLTGTVRRVRTRATTIVDFDNKDIVIPNKTFITERFVNWTLTDTTTRVILKVGVDYASDPEQVRSTLLEIANSHPAVLQNPKPVVLFMLLGNSTLDFELRFFVRELSERLRTTHELHTRIITEFRARGISIAFPQMDVHLRPPPAGEAAAEAHA